MSQALAIALSSSCARPRSLARPPGKSSSVSARARRTQHRPEHELHPQQRDQHDQHQEHEARRPPTGTAPAAAVAASPARRRSRPGSAPRCRRGSRPPGRTRRRRTRRPDRDPATRRPARRSRRGTRPWPGAAGTHDQQQQRRAARPGRRTGRSPTRRSRAAGPRSATAPGAAAAYARVSAVSSSARIRSHRATGGRDPRLRRTVHNGRQQQREQARAPMIATAAMPRPSPMRTTVCHGIPPRSTPAYASVVRSWSSST